MARQLSRERSFSRDNDFVVVRPMELDGGILPPGAPVPKERFTTRRLRILHEQRQIEMVQLPPPAPPKVWPDQPKRTTRHVGGGRWLGFENGASVTKTMTKAEAQEWAHPEQSRAVS